MNTYRDHAADLRQLADLLDTLADDLPLSMFNSPLDMQVNVAVDPEVLGGIKIQVGSEVVDGTVVSRLADARRRLVG